MYDLSDWVDVGVRRRPMPSTITWSMPSGWRCMEHICFQHNSRQVWLRCSLCSVS